MVRNKRSGKGFNKSMIKIFLIIIFISIILFSIIFFVKSYYERTMETEFEIHIRNETNETISIGIKINNEVKGHMNITSGETSKLKGKYKEGSVIYIENIENKDINYSHKMNREHVIFYVYANRIEVQEVWY
jgi:hypothetical protein